MTASSPLSNISSPVGQYSVSLSTDKKTITLNFGDYNVYEVKSAKGDLAPEVMEALESLFKEQINNSNFQKNIDDTAKNQKTCTCRVDLQEKKCIFYENKNKKSEYSWKDSAEKTRTAASSVLPSAGHSVPVSISVLPNSTTAEMHAPIGIRNPNIACYRIASIQSLLACPSFRLLLEQKITNGKDAKTRNTIRSSLLDLVQMLENQKSTPGALSKAEVNLNKLIEAYSKQQEHSLTSHEQGYSENPQLDANDFVEFLLTEVLTQSHEYEKTVFGMYTPPDNVDGLTYEVSQKMAPPPADSVLSFNFQGISHPTLSELVTHHFQEHVVNDKGQTTKVDGHDLEVYNQSITILGPPKPMFALRMERGRLNDQNQVEIDTTPITIPDNHRIDLSTAYGNEKGTNLYAISSFIIRLSMKEYANRSGHFISYVKKGNQWFECNDDKVTALSEENIKKIMPSAYMFFLEKCESEKTNKADAVD